MVYLVRCYTKTGIYSEVVESSEGMEKAFQIGKEKIKSMHPLGPAVSWCIDREQ